MNQNSVSSIFHPCKLVAKWKGYFSSRPMRKRKVSTRINNNCNPWLLLPKTLYSINLFKIIWGISAISILWRIELTSQIFYRYQLNNSGSPGKSISSIDQTGSMLLAWIRSGAIRTFIWRSTKSIQLSKKVKTPSIYLVLNSLSWWVL